MTYVSTQFGVPVKRPQGNVIPGPFKASRISPEMEERIGEIMKAAALREGHVRRLPPTMIKGAFQPENYENVVLRQLETYGRVSGPNLRKAMGISENNAERVLTHMAALGLVQYVSGAVKKWELA